MPDSFKTDANYNRGNLHYWDRVLSPTGGSAMWRTCPWLAIQQNPGMAVVLQENFSQYNATATTGDWVLTQSTTGSAAMSTTETCVLSIDSGSTTVVQGANLQRVKSQFLLAAGKSLWFEIGVKFTGVDNLNVESFVGLAAIDTTIIAASAQSTNNRVGWGSVTDDGVFLFQSDKAGTGTTTTGLTIAASTWYKLGFVYDGTDDTITQYVDGVPVGSVIATTHIPKAACIVPSLVCQSGGTDQPVLHVRNMTVVQYR